jgi:hypothetical protein
MYRKAQIADREFDVYYRDVIACVRALFGDPEFDSVLVLKPERHYQDASEKIRIYHDMHTGRWWWDTQVSM